MTRTPTQTQGGLRGFLNKGGFWRLLLVVAVYFAIYLPTGKVVARLADRSYSDDDLLSSLGSVFVQLTAALIVGSIVLFAFTTFMGWNAEIFGRQPIYRSRWMWIAPVIVLVPITLRVLAIDWGGPALSVVLLVLATGALIGFSEELLYRGIAVKMLRSSGQREWSVAAISSVLFGLSHGLNIFSGEPAGPVAYTVLYTVAFGVLMYLSMRVIGFIAAAMILHGLTDPTTLLSTGGLPGKVDTTGFNGLLALTSGFTLFLLVPVGYILAFFIRGKVGERKGANAEATV
ncbi:CPBP family intramembrane glutamic endopeptidase [Humibacillus xanthopallidus]|uniref:CPBP family intramembrane glutamic endopeptidase n=1 Tax=Humibacillus xanthopallidus TaxID=412689 RepID=UPI001151388F|nr:CPBP family intramembrane glutamic endopeptidase [Humibacillus xanthopallidus]